jgi:uncharacterized protein
MTSICHQTADAPECGEVWAEGLPEYGLGWFDEKVVNLAEKGGSLSVDKCARCSFGDGEIAVAPSGNLYPCERLIGEDRDEQPMKLSGDALDGQPDFVAQQKHPAREDAACGECTMEAVCTTYCRCSNFVRTGDIRKPDGLLCLWNQTCLWEVEKRMVTPGHHPLEVVK